MFNILQIKIIKQAKKLFWLAISKIEIIGESIEYDIRELCGNGPGGFIDSLQQQSGPGAVFIGDPGAVRTAAIPHIVILT